MMYRNNVSISEWLDIIMFLHDMCMYLYVFVRIYMYLYVLVSIDLMYLYDFVCISSILIYCDALYLYHA